MNKMISVAVFAALMLGLTSNASASWWGSSSNECHGPYGKIPNCNEYDEWDPRYWMEEMEDMFSNDDDDNYYRGGYGYPQQQQYAPAPYYGGGYGYPQQQQQYAPAPVAPVHQQ